MKHKLLSLLLALSLSLALLAAAIHLPATANGVMLPLMVYCAPPEDTRLPAAEYAPVVQMLTAYLKGGEVSFQHVFTLNGIEYAAFNQKEQIHMADVQGLFRLCRMTGWLSGGVVIALMLLLRRKIKWRTFRRTLITILAAVMALIALACIDFEALFVLFHRLAFTNELWLLDPSTDLLIRLMPLEFFISYAAIIGGGWLLGMVGLLVGSTIIIRKPMKGSESR